MILLFFFATSLLSMAAELGLNQKLQGKFDVARKLLNQSLTTFKEIAPQSWAYAEVLNHFGDLKREIEGSENALELLDLSYEISTKNQDKYRLAQYHLFYSRVLTGQRKPEEAKVQQLSSLSLAVKIKSVPLVLEILTGIMASEIQSKSHDSDTTIKFLNFVLHHDALSKETQKLAYKMFVQVKSKVSKATLDQLKAESRSLKLEDVVGTYQ